MGKKLTPVLWFVLATVVSGFLFACAAPVPSDRPDDAYVKAAWAYFKHKCDTEAGEKIYKTFTGVKSVLVVKPLPPATEKDLYDQFWYGDPYSNVSILANRGELHAGTLIRDRKFIDGRGNIGFQFFENKQILDGEIKYLRIESSDKPPYFISKLAVDKSGSKFGIAWEDISRPEDRKFWVAGSRLRIINLADKSIVAERIGYFIEPGFGSTIGQRRPWQASRGQGTTCPSIVNGTFEDRWFVLKVLSPSEGKNDGK